MRPVDADALIDELSRFAGLLHEDTITRLQMAVNELPSVQQEGWISVKDRLPEAPPWDAKWVIVWFGKGSEIHTEAPAVGKYEPDDDTWTVLGKVLGAKTDIMKVTHWMPMPEPPKEGEQNV